MKKIIYAVFALSFCAQAMQEHADLQPVVNQDHAEAPVQLMPMVTEKDADEYTKELCDIAKNSRQNITDELLARAEVLLRDKNANPNVQLLHGTLFMESLYTEDLRLAELLFKYRVDIEGQTKSGWRALHSAVANPNKNLAAIKFLTKTCKVKVDARDKFDRTPLIIACNRESDGEVAEFLIAECRACIDAQDKRGYTPLSIAYCNPRIVNCLLANYTIDLNDKYIINILSGLCIAGKLDYVKNFVRAEHMSKKNTNGASLLITACYCRNIDIVRFFIDELKASTDEVCENVTLGGFGGDCNALMYASWDGNYEIAKLIFDYCTEETINAVNHEGNTALIFACMNKHPKIAELILNRCTPETISARNRFGNTALSFACMSGLYDIVVSLLNCCNLDVINAVNHEGNTALIFACMNKHPKIAELILSRCSPETINAVNHEGNTALSFACINGDYHLAQFLAKYCTQETIDGRLFDYSPLMYATLMGHYEIIKLFAIDYKANTAHQSYMEPFEFEEIKENYHEQLCGSGNTALILACWSRNYKAAQLLARHCTPETIIAQNKDGDTALNFLLRHRERETAQLLAGFYTTETINAKDKDGYTALFRACEHKREDIVEIFLSQCKTQELYRQTIEGLASDILSKKFCSDKLYKFCSNTIHDFQQVIRSKIDSFANLICGYNLARYYQMYTSPAHELIFNDITGAYEDHYYHAISMYYYKDSTVKLCLDLAIEANNQGVFGALLNHKLELVGRNNAEFIYLIDYACRHSSQNIIRFIAEFACKQDTATASLIFKHLLSDQVSRQVINANCYELASLICLRTGTYREIRNNYFKIGDFKRANDNYIKLYNFIQQNLPNDDLRMYSQNPTIFMSAECIVSLESKIFAIEQRTYPSLFVDELPEANDTLKARSNAIVPILMEETWTKIINNHQLVDMIEMDFNE